MIDPYYDVDGVTIYHGDCRDVLVDIDPSAIALVLTDPPYGISERTDRRQSGRSSLCAANDFAPVVGDDEPFDPTHLLRFPRLILFGANYYAGRLPPSPSWVVWDKLDGMRTDKRLIGVDDNADFEMAWTNCGGPARLVPHRWKGLVRATERGERSLHPTQKPVWLMERLIEWRSEPDDLILDPYAGCGPVLRAAKNLGRRAIGCEIVERYCQIAAERLAQGVLEFGA